MSGCYCCAKPTSTTTSVSSMDLDTALNELGMLSTVTDGRHQYRKEQASGITARRRDRQLSEPSVATGTPSNSPQRGTYQIVHINPTYVTSLTTVPGSVCYPGNQEDMVGCPDANSLTVARDPVLLPVPTFGAKYSQDSLERDSRATRLTRMKLARLKRFKRPYDVPWRQTSDFSFQGALPCPVPQETQLAATVVTTTPDRLCRGGSDNKLSNSNASTPEKASVQRTLSLQRSRSLDELDFAKLQHAETENHNTVLEKREIDNMSHHLRNLQVTE